MPKKGIEMGCKRTKKKLIATSGVKPKKERDPLDQLAYLTTTEVTTTLHYRIYEFCGYVKPLLDKFPTSEKFAMANEIRRIIYEMLEAICRYELCGQISYLYTIDGDNKFLRDMFKLARDSGVKVINNDRIRILSLKQNEIGRLLGGIVRKKEELRKLKGQVKSKPTTVSNIDDLTKDTTPNNNPPTTKKVVSRSFFSQDHSPKQLTRNQPTGLYPYNYDSSILCNKDFKTVADYEEEKFRFGLKRGGEPARPAIVDLSQPQSTLYRSPVVSLFDNNALAELSI